MKKALLIDEYDISRMGLKLFLTYSLDLDVDDRADESVALAYVENNECSIVIFNYRTMGKNGINLIKQIHCFRPDLPVMVISDCDDEHVGIRVFKAGASGHICRNAGTMQLMNAVRKLLTGEKYITPSLAELLMNGAHGDTSSHPVHEHLSDREYQVFCLLASGKSVSDIAGDLKVSVKTVSSHRSRIIEKTRLKNNAEIIQYAVRNEMLKYT